MPTLALTTLVMREKHTADDEDEDGMQWQHNKYAQPPRIVKGRVRETQTPSFRDIESVKRSALIRLFEAFQNVMGQKKSVQKSKQGSGKNQVKNHRQVRHRTGRVRKMASISRLPRQPGKEQRHRYTGETKP